MKARVVQSVRAYNHAHAKVFTNACAPASMQSFTRSVSHVHLMSGLLVGDGIVLRIVFSDSSRHDEGRGQKRLQSRSFGFNVKSRAS